MTTSAGMILVLWLWGLHGCSEAEILLRDPLLAGDWDDPRCDRLSEDVADADQNTVVDSPPKMAAKWVSEGCEVRPGPEFLLRSYTFLRNGTFRLLQFHYGDESCSMPLYTMSARGRYRLRGRSWLTPAATEAEYTLSRVTVTAQSAEVAEELAARVNATCPGQVRRRWKPYREYVVLSLHEEGGDLHQPMRNDQPRNNMPPSVPRDQADGTGRSLRLLSTSDVDCLSALHAAFHELQLVRTQRRPLSHPPSGRSGGGRKRRQQKPSRASRSAPTRHELLLGDVHSRPEQRGAYRPTAFQGPLLRVDQAHGCHVCHEVARATERSPPHLHKRPFLPPYFGGDWVSGRCETRPLGLFLRRRLRVRAQDSTWQGEYEFYSDPLCTVPTFTAAEAGRYLLGGRSALVQGALEADFRVEWAALTILDPGMARSLQADPRCGGGLLGLPGLQVGVPRDLTATHGCAPLGIVVPSVRYDLVRVDVDAWGQSLLLLGQPDTENRRGGPRDRPTAYQPALVRCRGLARGVSGGLPLPHAEQQPDLTSGAPSPVLRLLLHVAVLLVVFLP